MTQLMCLFVVSSKHSIHISFSLSGVILTNRFLDIYFDSSSSFYVGFLVFGQLVPLIPFLFFMLCYKSIAEPIHLSLSFLLLS